MSPLDVWQQCLLQIKDKVATQTFETWFEPLKATDIGDTNIVLQVPSKFHFEWLDSHYRPIILDTLKSITQKDLQVRYSVVLGEDPEPDPTPYFPSPKKIPLNGSQSPQMNPRFIFDNFIEGAGNQFAKAAASSLCKDGSTNRFNPLVIYGGVGLGKTHLLQAVGNEMLARQPGIRIVYTTSEKFTLDFIASIQKNNTASFSTHYRNVDMLLVDDIQFFQKKEQTQEQFFHTFNDLHQRGKQIVMTMDKAPSELSGLKERLISRFQSGLTVDIQAPDFETRIAILNGKAEADQLDIPYAATEYIASCIKTNVRDLEGALIRLLAYSSLRKQEITLDLARQVVKELLGKNATRAVSVDSIIKLVSKEYNIRETNLVGKGRRKDIAHSRQLAMYLSRELTDASLVHIGLHFAGRDHSTVIHACNQVEKRMSADAVFAAKVDNLQSELANSVF